MPVPPVSIGICNDNSSTVLGTALAARRPARRTSAKTVPKSVFRSWLVVAALSPSLFGCTTERGAFREYPSRWPPLQLPQAGGKCPSLAGDYRYFGEIGYPQDSDAKDPQRFDIVALGLAPVLGNPRTVTIAPGRSDGSLVATIHGTEMMWPTYADDVRRGLYPHITGEVLTPSPRVTLSKPVRCVGGWTTITRVYDGGGNGESGSTTGQETIRLATAQDGSLIAAYASDTLTEFALGAASTRHRGTLWYRFLPARPASR